MKDAIEIIKARCVVYGDLVVAYGVVDRYLENIGGQGELRLQLKDALKEPIEQLDELTTAIRVLERLEHNEKATAAPDDEDDDEKELRTQVAPLRAPAPRPEGIPSNLEMVVTLLKEAKERGDDSLTSARLLAGVRVRWYPTAPDNLVAAFHDFATRGKIKKVSPGVFALNPNGTQGTDRDKVLEAKRAEKEAKKIGTEERAAIVLARQATVAPPPVSAAPKAHGGARSFEHKGREIMLSVREWRLVNKLFPSMSKGHVFPPDVLRQALWPPGERAPISSAASEISMMKVPLNVKLEAVGLELGSNPMGYFLKELAQ